MGTDAIGRKADADGSGSSAHPAAPAAKPKTEATEATRTQSNQAGSAKAPTGQAKVKAGNAAVEGGSLPPAEPDPALIAGARKAWASAAERVPACKDLDTEPLVPFLNQMAFGAATSNKVVTREAVQRAGNLVPEIQYLPGIHDAIGVGATGQCITKIFDKPTVGETLVRQAVDDNQFDRVTEEVLALNAAIVAKGGLEKAFEGPIALGAAVEKAQDDQSPGGEYAARTVIYHAAEWVLGPRVADGRPSSAEDKVHRLSKLVTILVKDAEPFDSPAPDGSAQAGVKMFDRNLLAAIVILCAKGMGDDASLGRLEGILESIVKPAEDEIAKWPELKDKWFAPVIEWIDKTIDTRTRSTRRSSGPLSLFSALRKSLSHGFVLGPKE